MTLRGVSILQFQQHLILVRQANGAWHNISLNYNRLGDPIKMGIGPLIGK